MHCPAAATTRLRYRALWGWAVYTLCTLHAARLAEYWCGRRRIEAEALP